MSDLYAFTVVAVIALVTLALRVAPFLAMGRLGESAYLRFLGQQMPTGVMILLVAYTVKDQDLSSYPYGLPLLGSLVLAAAVYAKSSNALVGIGGGLAFYMTLVNLVI